MLKDVARYEGISVVAEGAEAQATIQRPVHCAVYVLSTSWNQDKRFAEAGDLLRGLANTHLNVGAIAFLIPIPKDG